MVTYKSAQMVSTKEGRQYHIGLAPGELAPFILVTGEPDRARRVSTYFDTVTCERASREYLTFTGVYKGVPLSVMATGMGPDNTEIACVELCQIVEHPTVIRIGSSGSLKKGIELADLVISTSAVRLENTSTSYVVQGYPAVAHYECVLALLEAANKLSLPHHLGVTATASGFYGSQGRAVPGFTPRNQNLPAELDAMNVSNLEMEASCWFTLGTYRGFRTGAVCAVYANRHKDVFIDTETKDLAEKRCIETGLEAILQLHKMDQAKKKHQHWFPSLGM